MSTEPSTEQIDPTGVLQEAENEWRKRLERRNALSMADNLKDEEYMRRMRAELGPDKERVL